MPRYIYECLDCQKKAIKANPDRLIHNRDEPELETELYETLVLFETSHGMNPSEEELAEALVCPRCRGINCNRSFHGIDIHSYTLGYGYCDKVGAKRDMDIFTLQNNDPYKEHRVDGEVDDIATKLKKGPVSTPKHFIQKSDDQSN